MATAVNLHHEEDPYQESAPTGWRERTEKYRLRPIPNEDIYFYSKKISNERLVRPVNHAARRKEICVMAGGFVMLLLVVALTLPYLLNVMAGVQVQKLRAEHESLMADHEVLALREAEVMSPERMKRIARQRNMVELAPSRLHHLDPSRKAETLEAKLNP